MNQRESGSQSIGWGSLFGPGIRYPFSPSSTGGAAPNSSSTWSQKSVLPDDVVLIEPDGSATAS